MAEPPEIRALCEELSGLAGEYERLRENAEAAVASWRWARVGSGFADPWPFASERAGEAPGRLLGGPPRRKADGEELGFDAQDRVVVERAYDDAGDLSFETFALDDAHGRLQVTYERGTPANVSRTRSENGRLAGVDTCARRGHWNQEHYEYDGDRIVAITRTLADPGDEVERERWEISYDDAGRAREITLVDGPEAPMRVWTRPTRSLEALERDVVEGLTSAVERVVGALKLDEPVFCLALAYDAALPPWVGLGLVRERADLPAEDVWNPAEFELYGEGLSPDGDAALVDHCRELTQRLAEQEREIEGVQAVCNAVAKRLNAVDWAGRLPTSDDFVAYAVDLELADLEENLRVVLGRRRVRQLVKQGLLPETED